MSLSTHSGTLSGPRGTDELTVEVAPEPSSLAFVIEAQRSLVAASHHPDALLQALADVSARLLGFPARVAMLEGDHLFWRFAAGTPLPGHRVPLARTVVGLAMTTGRAQRVGETLTAGHLDDGSAARSVLAVPLTVGTARIGVIALHGSRAEAFDQRAEDLVRILATTASSGLTARSVATSGGTGSLPVLAAPAAGSGPAPDPGLATGPVQLVEGDVDLTAPVIPPHGFGLWAWDAATGESTWSPPVAQMLGLPVDSAPDLTAIHGALHRYDAGRFEAAVRAIRTGHGAAGAVRVLQEDGSSRQVYAWSEVRRDPRGALLGAWGGVVDVTDLDTDAAALRGTQAGLRAVTQITGVGLWEWHPASDRLTWSDEMFAVAGRRRGDVEPSLELWHSMIHPDDLERARKLEESSSNGVSESGVLIFRIRTASGQTRHVRAWSTVVGGVDGDVRTVCGGVLDVTRQVADRSMLERLSTSDTVTGLGNRLAFDRRVQELLSARPHQDLALLLIDLDRFKLVNDNMGHQVGDRLLVDVAERLRQVVPHGTTTARMGGDEFAVVPPPGTPAGEVRKLAQQLVDSLRVPHLVPETGEMLLCPASVGVALTGPRRMSVDDLLREAERALYRAKDSGRDRFSMFDDALRARAQTRQRTDRLLRSALADGRLSLDYQPVVDFSHGRVVGAEGLVRLFDPDDGSIHTPESFMNVAEETGLVVDLDCWVIDSAIAQLRRWGENPSSGGRAPWLSVNVSAHSMGHPRVVGRILTAIGQGRLAPDRLRVELTEHSFLGALPNVENSLRQLISAGVPVGIDDFGTGYAALSYLRRFDVDFLKIDSALTVGVGDDDRADALVMAMVDLGHAHGMHVTAEGVETPRQARRLREIGCDLAQGYHFGRAGKPSRIAAES